MDRRDFINRMIIGGSGASLGVSGILEALIRGRFQEASAQSSSQPRSHICFMFGGGLQWWYLCPMNPNSEAIISNPYVATNFKSGAPIYETVEMTVKGKRLRVPSIWATNIPTADGAQTPMARLLENMGFLRGFHQNVDNHGINRLAFQLPESTARSIPGIIADEAIKNSIPIPSLFGSYNSSAFRSNASSNLEVDLQDGGLSLSTILDPFRLTDQMQNLMTKRSNFDAEYQAVMSALKTEGALTNERISSLFDTNNSFEDLVRRDFGNLSERWTQLEGKYASLISRSTNLSDYLTDPILSADMPADWRRGRDQNGTKRHVINEDLRNLLTPNSRVAGMARAFALAEFVVTERLGASLVFDFLNSIPSLFVQLEGTSATNYNPGLDNHEWGVAPSIVTVNFAVRSLSACLYELMTKLRAKNLGDQAIIQIGSEFSRSPRKDGTGSDHGFRAATSAILSDAIKVPFVAGNIRRGTPDSPSANAYTGTWLYGAGNPDFDGGNTTLTLGHLASSICRVVKVPSPTPNFQSLLEETSSGGIQSVVGDGEVIDE